MFLKNIKEQIYALAGLHQACLVVSNLAWRGEYENKDFDALINCIIDTKSTTIENIFISQNYIEKGLKHLKKQIIDDIFTRSSETRRYISSLEALVNKVGKSEEMISDIGKSIDKLDSTFNTFTYDEKTKIISDIYQTTLSKIEPRIVVSGKNEYLTKHDISSRIRTALFAGVRCVYLYQQYGGNKIKFFLFKKNYTEMLKEIIKTKLS